MKFEDLVAEMKPLLHSEVETHPFIARVFGQGQLTQSNYAAYLRETFHLVQQTPHFLAAAAARCTDDWWLRNWFLDFAIEERGHDMLCVRDLRKMGLNPDEILDRHPDLGAYSMFTHTHFLARVGDPAGIIGFAAATEGMGADLATGVSQHLEATYPFTKNATAFLRVHGHEDVGHVDHVKKAFERYADDPRRVRLIRDIWRLTIRSYGQLFTDVLAQGDNWLEIEAECAA